MNVHILVRAKQFIIPVRMYQFIIMEGKTNLL